LDTGELACRHERSFAKNRTITAHIAIALGIRACLAGQRVLFRTATEWVALLADAQRQARLDDELARLQRVPLLICDEVGSGCWSNRLDAGERLCESRVWVRVTDGSEEQTYGAC
jgi:hypothetical protein